VRYDTQYLLVYFLCIQGLFPLFVGSYTVGVMKDEQSCQHVLTSNPAPAPFPVLIIDEVVCAEAKADSLVAVFERRRHRLPVRLLDRQSAHLAVPDAPSRHHGAFCRWQLALASPSLSHKHVP